jgi:hypothetical protein
MIRLSTLFWLVLVSATGFAMFAVKYEVQALADELAQTTKRAGDAEHDIRALDAEWAYLNRPDALAQMNQRYLSLVPIATKQLRAGVADLPMRPVPPPPTPQPAPIETVAADGAAVASVAPQQSAPSASEPPSDQAKQESPPAERAAPVVTAALETRLAAAEPIRPVPGKSAAKPRPPRRAKSLDDLIAQIAETR